MVKYEKSLEILESGELNAFYFWRDSWVSIFDFQKWMVVIQSNSFVLDMHTNTCLYLDRNDLKIRYFTQSVWFKVKENLPAKWKTFLIFSHVRFLFYFFLLLRDSIIMFIVFCWQTLENFVWHIEKRYKLRNYFKELIVCNTTAIANC